MSDKINEVGFNNRPNIKDIIKVGKINSIDIDKILAGIGEKSKETVAFQSDLYRVGLEIQTQQIGENGQEFNQGLDNILSQFLTPQNLTA